MRRQDGEQQEISNFEIETAFEIDFSTLKKHDEEKRDDEDPYTWINDCDRHLIGAPEDKACRDYVSAFVLRREIRAHYLSLMYAGAILPPPLCFIVQIILVFRWAKRHVYNR